MAKPVVYVAGKFRGPNGWVIAENIRAAERVGYEVAAAGAMPLIPHANTAMFHGTFTDEFWLEGTLELLRRCDALITVPGWEASEGTREEVKDATKRGQRVFHSPTELRAWLKAEGVEGTEPILSRVRKKLGADAIIGRNDQFPDAPFHVGVQEHGDWKWFGSGKTWEEALENVKRVKYQKADRSFVFEDG